MIRASVPVINCVSVQPVHVDPYRCNIAGKNAVHCAILSDNEDAFIVGMLKQLLGDDTQW